MKTIQRGLEIEKENEYLLSLKQELISKQKEKLDALQKEASADFSRGDFKHALQKYDDAIAYLDELSLESHQNRYQCAYMQGKWESAAGSAAARVSKGDCSAEAYTNLADVNQKLVLRLNYHCWQRSHVCMYF